MSELFLTVLNMSLTGSVKNFVSMVINTTFLVRIRYE